MVIIAASACRESPGERRSEPYPGWHTPAGSILPEHVLLDRLLESNVGLGAILKVGRRHAEFDPGAARVAARLIRVQERESKQMRAILADRLRDVHDRAPAAADSIAAAALQSVPTPVFATELRRVVIDHHRREIALIDSSPIGYREVQELVRGIRTARIEELAWLERQK